MKRLILIVCTLSLAIGLEAFARDQQLAKVPDSLKCRDTLCIYGGFCQNDPMPGDVFVVSTKDGYKVVQDGSNDQVVLDASDGDQVETITFQKEGMTALVQGSAKSIRGVRNVGFWWADGDHSNALTVAECTK
jgi:hypothetical protein